MLVPCLLTLGISRFYNVSSKRWSISRSVRHRNRIVTLTLIRSLRRPKSARLMATRTVRRDGGADEGCRKVRRSDGGRERQGELRRRRRTPPEDHPLRESEEGHHGFRVS